MILSEGTARSSGVISCWDQRERQIAAEDDPALPRQSVGKARRQRADAGDRHAAERDAGDEHIEPAQPAAHLAQRET